MILNPRIAAGIFIFILSVLSANVFSQNSFVIKNEKGFFKKRVKVVNDMVIAPVELNGRELLFLIDTGVNSTILFSFLKEDFRLVTDPSVIYLKGLGTGEPIRALKSKNNRLRLGDAISQDLDLYILEGGVLGISDRLGVPINGILGYDFFKQFVVEFNYRRGLMKVYHPGSYEYKDCRRCIEMPLSFYKEKPYIKAEVLLDNSNKKEVDLLVDSGSGDALWLFKDVEKGIEVPSKSFKDFLGFGLTGSVYGQRSRIESLILKDYRLKEITVSFPDSLSLTSLKSFEERDGSIGGQVLKRFHSVFDYRQKTLRLKPNSNFKKPFEYNMSGVVIKHSGFGVVKNNLGIDPRVYDGTSGDQGVRAYSATRKITYSLEPSYEIAEIRPGSPADLSGLMVGDEVLEINGRPVYKFKLKKITEILSSKEGRIIRMEVKRDGKIFEIKFRLERIL